MSQPANARERPLSDRYGKVSSNRRRNSLIVVVVAVVALGAWAIWAAIGQSENAISPIVQSYHVQSAHQVSVTVQVTRGSSEHVVCVVTALASDHSTVGETRLTIPPGGGDTRTLTATVKTERLAVSADIGDCHFS